MLSSDASYPYQRKIHLTLDGYPIYRTIQSMIYTCGRRTFCSYDFSSVEGGMLEYIQAGEHLPIKELGYSMSITVIFSPYRLSHSWGIGLAWFGTHILQSIEMVFRILLSLMVHVFCPIAGICNGPVVGGKNLEHFLVASLSAVIMVSDGPSMYTRSFTGSGGWQRTKRSKCRLHIWCTCLVLQCVERRIARVFSQKRHFTVLVDISTAFAGKTIGWSKATVFAICLVSIKLKGAVCINISVWVLNAYVGGWSKWSQSISFSAS